MEHPFLCSQPFWQVAYMKDLTWGQCCNILMPMSANGYWGQMTELSLKWSGPRPWQSWISSDCQFGFVEFLCHLHLVSDLANRVFQKRLILAMKIDCWVSLWWTKFLVEFLIKYLKCLSALPDCGFLFNLFEMLTRCLALSIKVNLYLYMLHCLLMGFESNWLHRLL